MCGVWTSHLQRSFPSIRDICAMDDLVEIDSNVANEATVCIMVPTAGEKMKNVKHVSISHLVVIVVVVRWTFLN